MTQLCFNSATLFPRVLTSFLNLLAGNLVLKSAISFCLQLSYEIRLWLELTMGFFIEIEIYTHSIGFILDILGLKNSLCVTVIFNHGFFQDIGHSSKSLSCRVPQLHCDTIFSITETFREAVLCQEGKGDAQPSLAIFSEANTVKRPPSSKDNPSWVIGL